MVNANRRFFYDCEFIDDGHTIDLISIGIVREDGEEFYAITDDTETIGRAMGHKWLRENAVPHLPVIDHGRRGWHTYENGGDLFHWAGQWSWDTAHPAFSRVMPRDQIAAEVGDFLVPVGSEFEAGETVELWADYSAYDHVALAQLWGPMEHLPPGLPMRTRDLEDLWEWAGRPPKPPEPTDAHDALADARWDRELWRTCWVVQRTHQTA